MDVKEGASAHREGTFDGFRQLLDRPPISRPTSRLWGLRFAGSATESAYRKWRVEHVRPLARFAMYSATSAVLLGALQESRNLALMLIPAQIFILVVGALVSNSTRHARWVMPASAAVNLLGGFLAVSMT